MESATLSLLLSEDRFVSTSNGTLVRIWAGLGSKESKGGFDLEKPPLTKEPLMRSGNANPLRNSYLKETLNSILQNQTVEEVKIQSSLAFYSQLFLVFKPNQNW